MSQELLPEKVVCKECFTAFRPEESRRTAGRCFGCGNQVCLRCGCTHRRACTREVGGRNAACSWEHGIPQLGAYCSFCVPLIAEFAYARATAAEDLHAE